MADTTDMPIGEELTEDDVTVFWEGKVQSALAEAQTRDQDPSIQIAEPQGWWNIWAIGPLQGGLSAPPGQIIRVGEPARVVTVIWLNAFYPTPSACSVISNLGCSCEIRYCTGDLCSWDPAPAFSTTRKIDLVPNRCFYVDTFQFTPRPNSTGLYEMNIFARLIGCQPGARPPFAAYATAVLDIDADIFYPPASVTPPGIPTPFPGVGPRWQFDIPIRFMVYA